MTLKIGSLINLDRENWLFKGVAMDRFLPLGSVVLLKNAEKRIIICGRIKIDIEQKQIYDYAGYLYPEGCLDSDEMILFNNRDIERIYFLGFQDEEERLFQEYIMEIMREKAEEQKVKQQNLDMKAE